MGEAGRNGSPKTYGQEKKDTFGEEIEYLPTPVTKDMVNYARELN